MSFADIEGGFTIRASRDAWETTKREIMEDFQGEDVTLQTGRIVEIAIAVGIAENKLQSSEYGDDPYRTSTESIDQYSVLKTLIEAKHPDENADGLQNAMIQYFEGGVQTIADEVDEKGYFDVNQYLPENVINLVD
ncbi:hypothetical protein [Haloferax volcanii]|uniref:hypothetical protein n=1 Tax=Haloferax volcanii TaxID=2246 RepID=UPI00385422D8